MNNPTLEFIGDLSEKPEVTFSLGELSAIFNDADRVITREEYINALAIVKAYQAQAKASPTDGDIVECVNVKPGTKFMVGIRAIVTRIYDEAARQRSKKMYPRMWIKLEGGVQRCTEYNPLYWRLVQPVPQTDRPVGFVTDRPNLLPA